MSGAPLREIRIERPLNRVNPIEAVMLDCPGLSLRTLATVLGAGRQTTLILFYGSEKDLEELTRRYIHDPPSEVEAVHILKRTPRRLLIHEVERSGVNPADISAIVQDTLGPETIVQIQKNHDGVAWTLLPFRQDRIPSFLDALASAGTRVGTTQHDLSWYQLARIARTNGIDEGRLHDQERRVLQAAISMGYYDWPKACHMREIAAAVDLPRSTAHYRLKKAEQKVLQGSGAWLT